MSEEVHRDRHQNGARALRSLSSANTDLDKKCENILFFCSFIFGKLNCKTLVTYISFIFNFQTTTPLMSSNDYVLYFSSPFKSAFRLFYACPMLSFDLKYISLEAVVLQYSQNESEVVYSSNTNLQSVIYLQRLNPAFLLLISLPQVMIAKT